MGNDEWKYEGKVTVKWNYATHVESCWYNIDATCQIIGDCLFSLNLFQLVKRGFVGFKAIWGAFQDIHQNLMDLKHSLSSHN